MNSQLAKKSYLYQGMNFDYKPVTKKFVESDVETSDLDAVLREIFFTDPVSGFPTGDIQYYMSKDGNPLVKDWLEKNLMLPREKPMNDTKYDDDLIFEMSKKSDESFDDYRQRITKIVNESVQIIKDE